MFSSIFHLGIKAVPSNLKCNFSKKKLKMQGEEYVKVKEKQHRLTYSCKFGVD